MPSGKLTITAPTGPGSSVTALVLNNVRNLNFDTQRAVLAVTKEDDSVASFDLNATATITATASAGVFAFVVSQ